MHHTALTLTLLITFCNATAQVSDHTFLQKLKGEWSANGKAFGMPARITMSWQPSLQDKFMQLTYRMEMKSSNGTVQTFEGTAFYQPVNEHEVKATWFDSGGEMHPIKGTIDGTTLTSIWGTDAKLGKTTYQFLDDDRIEIVDSIRKSDGTWKEFNRNTVSRN